MDRMKSAAVSPAFFGLTGMGQGSFVLPVPPNVIEPPPPRKDVRLGETIILECRSVGMPTPYINWRLNWGKVSAAEEGRGGMRED